MNISRPTFQRVLTSSRAKVADALVNGKLRVAGGNYRLGDVRFGQNVCSRIRASFGTGQRGRNEVSSV